MQPNKSDFRELERAMARFCLTKEYPNLPGDHNQERVSVYRDLIYSGFKDALEKAYPITKRVLGARDWTSLVKKFVAEFPHLSPQLWQMPRGLLEFVEQTGWQAQLYPFLRDLLEFEWVEIEVQMMPDSEKIITGKISDPLSEVLIINPEHRVSVLNYPVFRLSVDELRMNNLERYKSTYFLLTYRHPDTDSVRYVEISKFLLSILDLISTTKISWQNAFTETMSVMSQNISSVDVEKESTEALQMFIQKGVILGATKQS